MFQLEYIPWAVLVRSGRDEVDFKILIMGFFCKLVDKWDVGEKWQQLTSQSLDIDLMVKTTDGRHTSITNLVLCRSTSKIRALHGTSRCIFFIKHLL